MTSNNCLNCDKELTDKFCSGCGQKADTRRISFKNFIFHDLLHGTFHIERGMLFTAKQALLCPGKAALNYISGKRKRYYNVFLLILLTIGYTLFIRHFYDQWELSQGTIIPDRVYPNEASRKIDEIIAQKSKFIILLFVPFAALNSFILFRKKKLNLSEHTIIAGMVLLGMILISAIAHTLYYINLLRVDYVADVINFVTPFLVIIHIGYGYYNAFNAEYSKLGISYRVALFYGLFAIEIMLLVYLVIGIVTNWKYGTTVTISPFN